jgi:hypothetical protein
MRDDFEAFYAELDRRYGLSLVPRVRIGTITAVASATSCSLTLPGETTARAGVPVVCPVVPAVGQLVRVELVADHPVVVDVLGGGRTVVYQADVATGQTTASTTYVDLTTTGPTVTVPMLAGETVLVCVSFRGNNASGAGHAALMSFAVSGANTVAAQDADGAENDDLVTATITRWGTFTGAAAGDNVFTAKYKTIASGTSTFASRRLIVQRFS